MMSFLSGPLAANNHQQRDRLVSQGGRVLCKPTAYFPCFYLLDILSYLCLVLNTEFLILLAIAYKSWRIQPHAFAGAKPVTAEDNYRNMAGMKHGETKNTIPKTWRDRLLYTLPQYTGPSSVGYLEIEVPVTNSSFSHNKQNQQ